MRHEVHLVRTALVFVAAALVPLVIVGGFLGGTRGIASVLAGAGIVVANQAVAALSTGWSKTFTPRVAAIGYGVFVGRMFAVFAAFALLASAGWVHRGLVAVGFCTALAVTLGAECVSWATGRYVPRWRLTPQAAETHGWRTAR